MKLFKAVKGWYLSHIGGSVAAVFLLIPLWSVLNTSVKWYSMITAILQISFLYSSSWRYGDKDGRKIPGFYPEPKFAAWMAGYTAVISVVLLFLRFVAPNLWMTNNPLFRGEKEFLSTGVYFQGTTDLIYKLWFFPYLAFLGNGNFFLYLLPICVEAGVVFAGYYIGTKRFRLFDYLIPKLMFQKKK